LPAMGFRPPHAPKAMSGNNMIPDGLSEAMRTPATTKTGQTSHFGFAAKHHSGGGLADVIPESN
ncbi:hypothetical protein, partial [Belnapia arida]|uniref:hypothetical protein n=1 Tax=Belnapia arida TaxID=2804533 RepID=UPI001F3E4BDA